jgi:hypothetical protein
MSGDLIAAGSMATSPSTVKRPWWLFKRAAAPPARLKSGDVVVGTWYANGDARVPEAFPFERPALVCGLGDGQR